MPTRPILRNMANPAITRYYVQEILDDLTKVENLIAGLDYSWQLGISDRERTGEALENICGLLHGCLRQSLVFGNNFSDQHILAVDIVISRFYGEAHFLSRVYKESLTIPRTTLPERTGMLKEEYSTWLGSVLDYLEIVR
jgi:hypothetical protein